MLLRLVSALGLACLAAGLASERILREDVSDRVLSRVVVVPLSQFSTARFGEACRQWMRQNHERSLLLFQLFTSEADANSYGNKHVVHPSYPWWLRLYTSEMERMAPIAEVVAIHGSAVMRVREPSGAIRREVLSGEDPLFLQVTGTRVEILDASVWEIPEGLRDTGDQFGVRFYVRTPEPPQPELGRAVVQTLVQKTGVHTMSVWLRRDAWFIDEAFFPAAYRFEPLKPPISEEEYKRHRTLYCASSERGIRCLE